MQPLLSIIIPAYNEEKRLPDTLKTIQDFLSAQNYQAEVLVVENGSSDRTLAIAQEFASRTPEFQALHVDERGQATLALGFGDEAQAHGSLTR